MLIVRENLNKCYSVFSPKLNPFNTRQMTADDLVGRSDWQVKEKN